MAKHCSICRGRGRWEEAINYGEDTEIVWHYCVSCNGTGISQMPQDGEDFDINGSSYEEED